MKTRYFLRFAGACVLALVHSAQGQGTSAAPAGAAGAATSVNNNANPASTPPAAAAAATTTTTPVPTGATSTTTPVPTGATSVNSPMMQTPGAGTATNTLPGAGPSAGMSADARA